MSDASEDDSAVLQSARRKKAALRCIVAGVGMTVCGYLLYFAVGFFTGVYGICGIASASWTQRFDSLAAFVPVFGLIGFLVRWRLERNRLSGVS